MKLLSLRLVYWLSFILTIYILFLNFGIKLLLFGMGILLISVFHFIIGINLRYSVKHYKLLLYSSLCFLTFSLVRSDGVHTIGETGIGSLLSLFDLYWDDRVLLESLWHIEYLLLLQQFVLEFIIISRIQKEKETTR